MVNTKKIVDAAELVAARYEDDDRQDIKVDVLNAFYAGVKFGSTMDSILPKNLNGCGCICHRQPGVMHVMPCCSVPLDAKY